MLFHHQTFFLLFALIGSTLCWPAMFQYSRGWTNGAVGPKIVAKIDNCLAEMTLAHLHQAPYVVACDVTCDDSEPASRSYFIPEETYEG